MTFLVGDLEEPLSDCLWCKHQVQGVPLKRSTISSCTPAIVEMTNFMGVDDYIILQVGTTQKALGAGHPVAIRYLAYPAYSTYFVKTFECGYFRCPRRKYPQNH